MTAEAHRADQQRARRREQRQIHSDLLRLLLAEYRDYADDQPATERHAAARLGMSRSWMQWQRTAGNGPKFYRTDGGRIFYLKRDIEAFLAASLTAFDSTSQYRDAAPQ